MRTIASVTALTFALLCACAGSAVGGPDQCFICHSSLGDRPSSLFKNDRHHALGISCAGCHGGNAASDDMSAAMDTSAGFLGVPHGDAISLACARCHSSEEQMRSFGSSLPVHQWETLQASIHGKPVDSSGSHVVQCITCHSAHGIARVKDPKSPVFPLNVVATCSRCHSDAAFMRTFNPSLPVDQKEKYRTSVHGARNAKGDPKAAECVSCHGSHDIFAPSDARSHVYAMNLPSTCARCHSDREYMKDYKIPTDQFEKYARSVHGVALLQKHDAGAPACNSCHGNHGAAPPGVESISNVCGTCHALNAELFSTSPHKKAFDAQRLPECETCHGNHEILPAEASLLGTGDGAVCIRCHSATDRPAGFRAAATMRSAADSLNALEQESIALVNEAEQKGMEITDAKFTLRDVRQARLEAATTLHAFDPVRYQGVAERGITKATQVRSEAREAVQEFYFRRTGLGIASLIITTLAITLYLFIRRIERKGNRSASAA